MLKIDFSIFPVLYTERLILKEISPADAPALFAMRSNPVIMQYIDRPIPSSVDDIFALIEKMKEMKESGAGISWGIYKKEQPEHKIGNIGFFRLIPEHYRAEIGYMLTIEEHRKGYMLEAMQKVIEYGFNEIKLHSIEANINPANTASRQLLEKAGFVKEAYFRENYYFNGRFLDSEIFSLVNKGEKF